MSTSHSENQQENTTIADNLCECSTWSVWASQFNM